MELSVLDALSLPIPPKDIRCSGSIAFRFLTFKFIIDRKMQDRKLETEHELKLFERLSTPYGSHPCGEDKVAERSSVLWTS